MQQKLEKLKQISSVVRLSVWVVLVIGLGFGTVELLTSTEHRTVFDPNMSKLWESGAINKAWLIGISLPTLVLFLIFAWKFQYLLQLFSKGSFFSDEVISSFKTMLWTKILGVFTPWLQAASYAYLVKQEFGDETALMLEFNLWHVFTVLVLFTLFYLLNGAHQIEQENKEFI